MNPAEFANIARVERELWWYRGMERIFLRFAAPYAPPAGSRVVEAGCGTGYMSQRMAEHFRWQMFPADLSGDGLRYSRLDRRAQADLRAMPFASSSFDAVVSLDVIAHLAPPDDRRAFGEFARVLKPGAPLLLRTSALSWLRSRHSMFVGERQRYTKAKLRTLCAAAGLRVERLTYLNSILLPVAAFKFRVWEPLTNAPPASGVAPVPRWLNSTLEKALDIENALLGAGVNPPLGQSLLLTARKPT
ncbi:MAG: class I SAM-dependent methyltransferase [Bryobacteraceae bacterium]|nr:class I SAM-dependent methyltransferase [Bryobacteraceae bacterium]